MDTIQEYCGREEKMLMPSKSPSVLDTMKSKKLRLEQQLKAVNECIEGLEKHPEVTHVLELINKAR